MLQVLDELVFELDLLAQLLICQLVFISVLFVFILLGLQQRILVQGPVQLASALVPQIFFGLLALELIFTNRTLQLLLGTSPLFPDGLF